MFAIIREIATGSISVRTPAVGEVVPWGNHGAPFGRIFDIKVKGTVSPCKSLPLMRDGGTLVIIGSWARHRYSGVRRLAGPGPRCALRADLVGDLKGRESLNGGSPGTSYHAWPTRASGLRRRPDRSNQRRCSRHDALGRVGTSDGYLLNAVVFPRVVTIA